MHLLRRCCALCLRNVASSEATLSTVFIGKRSLSGFNYGPGAGLPSAPELKQKLSAFMAAYEEFIGIAHVKKAQDAVFNAEAGFLRAQSKRREAQLALNELQARLRDLHSEISKTARSEDRYLALVTEEHRALRDEQRAVGECRILERDEHELFAAFSNAVRAAHERERAQSEKTKYWSVVGSVAGAVIGVLGASFTNWLRMRELRALVARSASTQHTDDAGLETTGDNSAAGGGAVRRDLAQLSDAVERKFTELTNGIGHLQGLFDDESAASVVPQLREQLEQLKQLRYQLQISSCSWQPQLAADNEAERQLVISSVRLALAGVVCGATVAAILAVVFGR